MENMMPTPLQSQPITDAESLTLLQATELAFALAGQGKLPIVDLINAGVRLTATGHPDISISLYRGWLSATDSPLAYVINFNLGVLLANALRDVEAEAAYRAAIGQKKDFIEGHMNLGTLLNRNKREEEALAIWRAVLTFVDLQAPADQVFYVQALNNLGQLLEVRKDYPEAQAMLTLSLKQNPEQPNVMSQLVHLRQTQGKWPVDSAAIGIKAACDLDDLHRKAVGTLPGPLDMAKPDLSYLHAPYGMPDLDRKQDPNGRRYVLVAPPFQHNSAGIRVMYDLQKWLVRAGLDAIVCTWFNGYPVEQFEDDIVIYPEVAPGNLLKAKRVIRFILNVPGKLGYGEKTYDPGEILVAYNKELASYAHGRMLQVPSIEPFFNDEGTVKKVDSVFVGKGQDLGLHPPGCIAITKAYPPSRREVAQLLRSTRTLYMYDDFSMIAHEAKLCGCDVKLIRKDGAIVEYPDHSYPTIDEFKVQLHDFIEMTKTL